MIGCARHEEGDHGAGAADADTEEDEVEVEVEENDEVGAAPLGGRDAMIVVVWSAVSSSPFEQKRAPGRAAQPACLSPSDI